MYAIKIIVETPAFRKCNKNFACQWTLKRKITHAPLPQHGGNHFVSSDRSKPRWYAQNFNHVKFNIESSIIYFLFLFKCGLRFNSWSILIKLGFEKYTRKNRWLEILGHLCKHRIEFSRNWSNWHIAKRTWAFMESCILHKNICYESV